MFDKATTELFCLQLSCCAYSPLRCSYAISHCQASKEHKNKLLGRILPPRMSPEHLAKFGEFSGHTPLFEGKALEIPLEEWGAKGRIAPKCLSWKSLCSCLFCNLWSDKKTPTVSTRTPPTSKKSSRWTKELSMQRNSIVSLKFPIAGKKVASFVCHQFLLSLSCAIGSAAIGSTSGS